MEFNPLDLLACAAELQQRNDDDSPEPKTMTRQRRASSFSSSHSNKVSPDSIHKENNRSSPSGAICINGKNNGSSVSVRKHRVTLNSDLEKMLDEHNYGHAKKSHKHDKSIDVVVSGDSLLNRERTGSVSSDKQSSDLCVGGDEGEGTGGGRSGEIMSPEAQTVQDGDDDDQSESGRLTQSDVSVSVEDSNNCTACEGSSNPCEQHKNRNCSLKDNTASTAGQASDKSNKRDSSCLDTNESQVIKSPKENSGTTTTTDIMCRRLPGDNSEETDSQNNSSRDESVTCAVTSGSDIVDVESIESPSDSVVVAETGSTKVTATLTDKDTICTLPSVRKSDRAPQVRVISTEVLPDEGLEQQQQQQRQPQTVIINISKTAGSNTSVTTLVSQTESNARQTDLTVQPKRMVEAESSQDVGEQNSMLTANSVGISADFREEKSENERKHGQKLETIVHCDSKTVPHVEVNFKELSVQSDLSLATHHSSMCSSCETSQSCRQQCVHQKNNSSPQLQEKQKDNSGLETKCSELETVSLMSRGDRQVDCGDEMDTSVSLTGEECNSDSRGVQIPSGSTMEARGVEHDTDNTSAFCKGIEGPSHSLGDMTWIGENGSGPESSENSSIEPAVSSSTVDDREGVSTTDSEKTIVEMTGGGSRCEQSVLSTPCSSANDTTNQDHHLPVFRFVTDHCYAGIPGKIHDRDSVCEREEYSEEASTPSACSSGELSQDSGYGDITQSPDYVGGVVTSSSAKQDVKGSRNSEDVRVPVSSCIGQAANNFVLHKETSSIIHSSSTPLLGQLSAFSENSKTDSTCAVSQVSPQTPVEIKKSPSLPSVVTAGASRNPVLLASSEILDTEKLSNVMRPTTPEAGTNSLSPPQLTPSKFGKFRIGTFASFSNTTIGLEENSLSPIKSKVSPVQQQITPFTGKLSPGVSVQPSTVVAAALTPSPVVSPSRPWTVDVMGTIVRVREDLSTGALSVDTDHIQHDHDYCIKNIMPLVVNSAVESRFQKEPASKGKHANGKQKRLEIELQRVEGKAGKRGKKAVHGGLKDEYTSYSDRYSLDDNGYMDSFSSGSSMTRAKTRAEKYIEQKSVEPKVKITGSSNFQDQFVYFMNTKKRSRRRESRDSPLSHNGDKLPFQLPKPGDIVVPHLTDADIEVLKLRSKQRIGIKVDPNYSKASNSFGPTSSAASSQSDTADEESKIINTILSLETEGLQSADQSYTEPIEMYAQAGDLMNLLPEQMNLTQEQMELLYSAVDEVQNSSPGLVDSEKLGLPGSSDSSFGVIPPVAETYVSQSSLTNSPTAEHGRQGNSEDTTEPKTVPTTSDEQSCSSPGKDSRTDSKTDNPDKSTPNVRGGPAVIPSGEATLKGVSSSVASTVGGTSVDLPGDSEKTKISDVTEIQYDANSNIRTDSSFIFKPGSDAPAKTAIIPSTSESFVTPGKGLLNLIASGSGPGNSSRPSPVKSLVLSTASVVATQPLAEGQATQDIALTTGLSALDKTSLDLLGNDFRLDKADLFTETSAPVSETPVSTSVPTSVSSGSGDISTPWIATVSMYWNDLPAILINNLPFVRLVDIHKQILPAKDTGILKKRCQLLGIEVGNCSEMQRYFLVQYGKAVNSKSTLIVAKDDAKVLIGYYVDPHPKSHRATEEHKSLIELRRESLKRIALARRASRPSTSSPVDKTDTHPFNIAPVTPTMESPPALDGRTLTQGQGQTASQPLTSTPSGISDLRDLHNGAPSRSMEESRGPHTQRSTRHKKINFLELLRGDSTSSSIDEFSNGADDDQIDVKKDKSGKKKRSRDSSDSSERPAKRTKSQKVGTEAKIQKRIFKIPNGSEESTDSESEEDDDENEDSECTASEETIVSEHEESVKNIVLKKPLPHPQSNNGKKVISKKVVKTGIAKVPSIKVKVNSVGTEVKESYSSLLQHDLDLHQQVDQEEEDMLLVIHRSSNQRNGHRNKSQQGEVFVDQYHHKKSMCIRCYTCRRLMSVDNFLQHMHDFASNGRLVAVKQPQVLEPSNADLSQTERKLWDTFQRKKDLFENNQLPSPEIVDERAFVMESDSMENVVDSSKSHKDQQGGQVRRNGRRVERVSESSEGVRVSSRKRKQKQLYPFEKYTYVKKLPRLQVDSEEQEANHPSEHRKANTDHNMPQFLAKHPSVKKLAGNVTVLGVSGGSMGQLGSVGVQMSAEPNVPNKGGVVTLTNGPELTTYTALIEDMEI